MDDFPLCSLSVEVETERVAVRVEVDANVILRLVLGEGGSARLGVDATSREIVDLDFEVQHHLLFASLCRPDGTDIEIFCLE